MSALDIHLADEAATMRCGSALAQCVVAPCVLYFSGPLGTGKTALIRALLRAKGVTGTVRSPTYTLVEPYALPGMRFFHLDLYRLSDAEELTYLGIRDLNAEDVVLAVEWAERGADFLPPPDLRLQLAYSTDDSGRELRVSSHSPRGRALQAAFSKLMS